MRAIEVVTASGDTVVLQDEVGHALYWSLSAQSAPVEISSAGVLLLGWSVFESTGAAVASATLLNGTTSAADVASGFSLAAGGNSNSGPTTRGVMLERGLFLNILAGSVTGAIFYRRLPA